MMRFGIKLHRSTRRRELRGESEAQIQQRLLRGMARDD